jgi:hypothetical protein
VLNHVNQRGVSTPYGPGTGTGIGSSRFFAFLGAIRKIISTTDAIETLNSSLRRAVRIRGHFPTGEAAMKLIFLVLRDVKTQTVLPSAATAAMLFWALMASGQIVMRKIDGWRTLATKPVDQPVDRAT